MKKTPTEDDRKVFVLCNGKHKYFAPPFINAEMRADFEQQQMNAVVKDQLAADAAFRSQGDFQERVQSALMTYGLLHVKEYKLMILKLVLTPANGSPSVEQAFKLSLPKEVDAVVSFFNAS